MLRQELTVTALALLLMSALYARYPLSEQHSVEETQASNTTPPQSPRPSRQAAEPQTAGPEAEQDTASSAQQPVTATVVVTSTAPDLLLSDQLQEEQERAKEQALRRELAIQIAKTRERQREVLASEEEQPPPVNRRLVKVFFATDRKPTGKPKPGEFFGAQSTSELVYGTCDVLVPPDHRMGYLERPFAIAKIALKERDEKHVVLKDIAPIPGEDFFKLLSARVKQSHRRAAFVFIHGFNVTFAEAARRTAQIAYDLAFDGAPLLYSWSSHGVKRHYAADEDAVEDTVPRLEMFLNRLAIEGGVDDIYLIAHSMGNRALSQALERIYIRSNGKPSVRYRHVILTAPDIRTSTMKDLAVALKAMAIRVTMYSSDNDKALKLSRQINNYPRAGQAGDHLLLMDGIDTIDVSAVDTDFLGHFYYASNRSVLADIFQAIRCAEYPDDRFSLERRDRDGQPYWVFVR